MSDKKPAAAKPVGKESKDAKRKRVACEIDDLFAALPKRSEEKQQQEAQAAAAEDREGEQAAADERAKEQRRKEKEYYLSNGERLAVQSAPRRYEDGLPVFKSFEDFSDLKADQRTVKAPKTGKTGKCPFDCWCCY